MIVVVLVLLATFLVFGLAFGLAPRLTRRIARAVAGVAVAVQVVAYILVIIIAALDYSSSVVLWIAVGWLAFPMSFASFGLAMASPNPPRIVGCGRSHCCSRRCPC